MRGYRWGNRGGGRPGAAAELGKDEGSHSMREQKTLIELGIRVAVFGRELGA